MRGWRIRALVAFVIGLGGAIFAYARARPAVNDNELRVALDEVDRIRVSLDDVECERPAILGPPTQDALPLGEVLSWEGPFAECWELVSTEEVVDYVVGGQPNPSFRFQAQTGYHLPPPGRVIDPELLRNILTACAGMPDEFDRQARTPNRCTPIPSSEAWLRRSSNDRSELPRLLIGRVGALIAHHGNLSADDRLRLVVQAMATARDAGQGPSGFLSAMMAAASEHHLAAEFVVLLQDAAPSPEMRAELRHALGELADMPIDVHTFLTSEVIAALDATAAEKSGEGEINRFTVYALATLLPRVMESCPTGVSVDACLSQFPYPTAEVDERLEWVFGRRYTLEDSLKLAYADCTGSYERYVRRMEGLRDDARALQEILRWEEERAEGRCPEVSRGNPLSDPLHYFVDRNEENLYQLVTPGMERHAFYFECPAPSDSLEHLINDMPTTEGL